MKAKILIVEDERIVAEDLKRNLDHLGYEVSNVASSGKDALKMIKENKPDLVLMDIVLRGRMSGIEAADIIRVEYNIPVIYVTAHADEKTLEKAKFTEPYGYILKPFDERELQSTIEMVLYKSSMEKRLRENETWLSTILKSIGDGVIVTDDKGCVTFVNQVAEHLTGKRQVDVLGNTIEDVFQIVHETTGETLENPINSVLKNESVAGTDDHTLLVVKNRKLIPISESATPIKDERGNIIGSVLIFHDITERKVAEEALRESEKRYRNLFEDSNDAIFIATRKGELIIANRATLEMFGYTLDEMVHLSIQALFAHPKEWDRFRKEIEDNGSVRDYSVSMKKKNGEKRTCLLTSSIRRSKEDEILGYHGIVRDITQQKRAEEEKESIQAQLLQAQKMEAVGILAGGIAHDFNNLLTIIQGNADIAMLKIDSSDRLFRDMKEIQDAASRAADLTNQLLLFSRKQTMRFCTLNFNKIIEETLKMLHRLIGEDIGIYTDLEQDLWTIRSDRGTMEQVIVNLAVNARDAMPNGGRLTIKTENVLIDDTMYQQMPEVKIGKFIRVKISDEGTGMDPETIQHIFEPFFSTKEQGSGTGLGLSVVYGIVKQHEGWIHVASEINQGTTFEIYLPATTSHAHDKKDNEMSVIEYKAHGECILVVEDEKGVLDFTETALKESGYKVFTASSAKEAMKVFTKKGGQFDLVLSDVVLPDKTGVELVSAFLTIRSDLKVLLCSGYTGKKSQWDIIQEKGFPFMHKPYSMQDLILNVRKALTSSRE